MAITYQDLVKRLKDAKELLELFALFKEYKAVFLNAPMLCFLDLEAGEFKDSPHDFSFSNLRQAIAKFHHILAVEEQKKAFQPPEPFSYEKHIRPPQKLGDYWFFLQDLRGIIGLNRHHRIDLEEKGHLFVFDLLQKHQVLEFEQYCDIDVRNALDVAFGSQQCARSFIERLNKFVDDWVTVGSLNRLLEMLHITDHDGQLISIDEETWDETGWEDYNGSLADDITGTIGLTNSTTSEDITLYNGKDAHWLKFPFDIREFWWRVRQLTIIHDEQELAAYLEVEQGQLFDDRQDEERDRLEAVDCLTQAIQNRINPTLLAHISITGSGIGNRIHFYAKHQQVGDSLYFPFSVEAFEQAIDQVNKLARS